jgi:hypothetical protein
MKGTALNLYLMIFWTLLFVGLMTREYWMDPEMLAKLDSPNTPLITALTGVFILWNFARYVAAAKFGSQKESKYAAEIREKIRGNQEDPRITDPQFKFDDPPGPSP